MVKDELFHLEHDFLNSVYNGADNQAITYHYNKYKKATLWYCEKEQQYKSDYGVDLPEYEIVQVDEFGELMQVEPSEEEHATIISFVAEKVRLKPGTPSYRVKYGGIKYSDLTTEVITEQKELVNTAKHLLEAANDLSKEQSGSKQFRFRITKYQQDAQQIISTLLPTLQNNKERMNSRLSSEQLLQFCDRVIHYREIILIKNAGLRAGISDEELRTQAKTLYEAYGLKPESVRGTTFESVELEQLFI